jgi:hypothetical protein
MRGLRLYARAIMNVMTGDRRAGRQRDELDRLRIDAGDGRHWS